jgi:Pyruvate/2-oxoacid:ferredoxin oxidoreductase delta subunit
VRHSEKLLREGSAGIIVGSRKESGLADAYIKLARVLDRFPNGYPATESGVELAILRKIFSPADAAMALDLSMIPETAEMIAGRLRRPVDEVRETLDGMADRGQIYKLMRRNGFQYALAPFVIGIYEFQLNRIDRELAELFEAYAPALFGTVGGSSPALARVVPVNRRIEAQAEILPYDDLRATLSSCNSFRVAECICRKEKSLVGEPCSHTSETCMTFAKAEDAYEGLPEWGREISREEALDLLDRTEEEGLVHCTYNVGQEPFFVCNCCSCCCGLLRGVNEFDAPYMLASSNFVSEIDAELCSECGDCSNGRCPVGAIAEGTEGHSVNSERCIGCGVCATGCDFDAIQLVPRPEEESLTPPETLVKWAFARTDHRHGRIKGYRMRGWLAWETLKMSARRRAEN